MSDIKTSQGQWGSGEWRAIDAQRSSTAHGLLFYDLRCDPMNRSAVLRVGQRVPAPYIRVSWLSWLSSP